MNRAVSADPRDFSEEEDTMQSTEVRHPDDLLTPREAREYIRVAKSTLYENTWIPIEGEVAPDNQIVSEGTRVKRRYRRYELDRYIAEEPRTDRTPAGPSDLEAEFAERIEFEKLAKDLEDARTARFEAEVKRKRAEAGVASDEQWIGLQEQAIAEGKATVARQEELEAMQEELENWFSLISNPNAAVYSMLTACNPEYAENLRALKTIMDEQQGGNSNYSPVSIMAYAIKRELKCLLEEQEPEEE